MKSISETIKSYGIIITCRKHVNDWDNIHINWKRNERKGWKICCCGIAVWITGALVGRI
ncbi:MAG: hypothetical protein WCT85_04110 [Parachlamydiales bacterium]